MINQGECVQKNSGIDLEKVVSIADDIMNLSPEMSWTKLFDSICEKTAFLTNASAATCRTLDPSKQMMFADGNFNFDVKRAVEIPSANTVAGKVISTKKYYCVPDINKEVLYYEKNKILALGYNSMLALPIRLFDYIDSVKKEVLTGALQLYFKEKNKKFNELEIKLTQSVLGRFNYILALKRCLEIQKRSEIIRESRRSLITILKRTQSVNQVLNFIAAKIAEVINVNRCSIFEIERDPSGKGIAILVSGYPLKPFAHTYGIALHFDENPAFREVYESGEPLLIKDALQDPRVQSNYDLYIDKNIKNVCFVPIKNETDTVTHVLVLDGDESKPLTSEDMFFLNALIDDIELCIHSSIQSQQQHDFLNQIIAFGAIAKIYTRKQVKPNSDSDEIVQLYKKMNQSMFAINDILADRSPYAVKDNLDLKTVIEERLNAYYFPSHILVNKYLTDDEVVVLADPRKVGRIIGNLLDNAHKKLQEIKQGELSIRLCIEDKYAVMEIGNTGLLPLDVQRKLKDSSEIYGLQRKEGLGLSIVKLFTIMHSGFFEYETSQEKNWTLFKVKLPLK